MTIFTAIAYFDASVEGLQLHIITWSGVISKQLRAEDCKERESYDLPLGSRKGDHWETKLWIHAQFILCQKYATFTHAL